MHYRTSKFKVGKHIAVVIHNRGGAERVCLDLSRNLIQKGCIVYLVLFEFQGGLLKKIPPEVNLFVLEEEHNGENGNNFCPIQSNKINWIVPTNSTKNSYHLENVFLN